MRARGRDLVRGALAAVVQARAAGGRRPELLRQGDDIRTGQEQLGQGHANVNTTTIYTHVLNRGGFGVESPADIL